MLAFPLAARLLRARVRPYYIFMCDNVAGVEHFKATVQKGLEIVRGLRGWTSGLAVPHFVIDAPGGGGKIPLLPEYLEEITETDVILRNYEGDRYTYPQPRKEVLVAAGVAEPEYDILPLSSSSGSPSGGNGKKSSNGSRKTGKGKRA